jgi:hypothetical protein
VTETKSAQERAPSLAEYPTRLIAEARVVKGMLKEDAVLTDIGENHLGAVTEHKRICHHHQPETTLLQKKEELSDNSGKRRHKPGLKGQIASMCKLWSLMPSKLSPNQ